MASVGMPIVFNIDSSDRFPAVVAAVDGSGNPTSATVFMAGYTPPVQGRSITGGRDDTGLTTASWSAVTFENDVTME